MRLTPENLTFEIVKASEKARAADAETLRSAGMTSAELIHQLRLGIGQVRVSAEQKSMIRWAVAAGIIVGILLWAILPGAFMRALPARWHAPEWMATRAMRADDMQAARRLFQVAHPSPSLRKVDAGQSRQAFADQGKLVRTLSRERAKDMASDYGHRATPERDFAERRGIIVRERIADMAKAVPEKVRAMFDGLRLSVKASELQVQEPQESIAAERDRAIARHARAVQAIFTMQDPGGDARLDQLRDLVEARRDLNALRQHAATDAESAYSRDASLAPEAAGGDTERVRLAIVREREVRTIPALRADRFVERWNRLSAGTERAYASGDYERRRALQDDMRGMAKSLKRDPQMESILANRKQQLGISFDSGRKLGAELAFHQGIDLNGGRNLGLGM
jgi:hypothetical protein